MQANSCSWFLPEFMVAEHDSKVEFSHKLPRHKWRMLTSDLFMLYQSADCIDQRCNAEGLVLFIACHWGMLRHVDTVLVLNRFSFRGFEIRDSIHRTCSCLALTEEIKMPAATCRFSSSKYENTTASVGMEAPGVWNTPRREKKKNLRRDLQRGNDILHLS